MSTLKRGVVKSYEAATHRATVQIAGSLAVWLSSVSVASDVPAAEVVAGRECAVLLFTDDNPDDGVVLSVHGSPPLSPPTGVQTLIRDFDTDTRVETEASPDEDRIRFTTAGVARGLMQSASPHHDLAGDMRISGFLRVNAATPDLIDPAILILSRSAVAGIDGKAGLVSDLGGTTTVSAGTVYGVAGRAVARDLGLTTFCHGLDYIAGTTGVALVEANGIKCQVIATGAAGSIGQGRGILIQTPSVVLATLSNFTGIEIATIGAGGTRRPFVDNGTAGAATNNDGNRFNSNTQFFSLAGQFGGGRGVLGIANAALVPGSNPVAGGVLYAEAGALKWRGSAGTVTTIAPA